MPKSFSPRSCPIVLLTLLTVLASVVPSFAQDKILGGYFEEWSIYYAGYNIANLQQNGVADKLTHLLYAFRQCNHDSRARMFYCRHLGRLSESLSAERKWSPYPGPMYGNFAAIQQLKQLHPKLKVLISLGGASAANTAAFVLPPARQRAARHSAASCIDLFVKGNIAAGIYGSRFV